MKNSPPMFKGLADEAEFQLVVARENLQWLSALARAIARDIKDAGGRDVERLIGLVSYLDDSGFSGIDDAIDLFKAASADVATHNADAENVLRTPSEARP